MADSPVCFGAGDELDRENLAMRLPAPDFDTERVAELMGRSTTSVWTLVKRGKLPEPDHYEQANGNRDRAVWKAEQLVGLVG